MASKPPTADPAVLMQLVWTAAPIVMRYLVFAIGFFGAVITALHNRDFNELVNILRGSDGVKVVMMLAAVVSLFIGIRKGSTLQQQVQAFVAALEKIGINSQAIDPTDKSVPTVQPSKNELVGAVVRANPVTAERAITAAKNP